MSRPSHALPAAPSATAQSRPVPGLAPHVLVAGSHACARGRVAALVGQALPAARVEEFPGVSDLVFRLAASGIDLILLEADASLPWPSGLARLLKSIQPRLRLATVAVTSPSLKGADASLTEATLEAWLQHPSRAWS